jgi:hypothetical protein
MLSAVVLATDRSTPQSASPEAVVRTLSALVTAAIEGLVRDVTLATGGESLELRKIADHAGCEIAEAADPAGAIAAGLASARGDLLLVLRAGYAPQAGFIEEIADMFQRATRPDALRFRAVPDSFFTRLAPGFSPIRGIVAKRSVLDATSPDLATLVRRAGAAPTARARLRPVD